MASTETTGAGLTPAEDPAEAESQRQAGAAAESGPSPDAVQIAPSGAESQAEPGDGSSSKLAGGTVLAVFILIALVIFFGRRLINRRK